MALPIEGFSIVVKKDLIQHLLASKAVVPPNAMAWDDGHIWKCSFMAEADARQFLSELSERGLNLSQGPNPDGVIVCEFDQSVEPYCEWLALGKWEKAIIAWLQGTEPETIAAPEGWDPALGSGLVIQDPETLKDLVFLRAEQEGRIEIWLNKKTGEEVTLARTSASAERRFEEAARVIGANMIQPGQRSLVGKARKDVEEATKVMGELREIASSSWKVFFFYGKGLSALGQKELAYEAFQKAVELETEVELIPCELAGVCLELGRFEEAVKVAEKAVCLQPDNPHSLGNLALAYLLAARLTEARKTIDAALRRDPGDKINALTSGVLTRIESGQCRQPQSYQELLKFVNNKSKSPTERQSPTKAPAPQAKLISAPETKKKRGWFDWLGF